MHFTIVGGDIKAVCENLDHVNGMQYPVDTTKTYQCHDDHVIVGTELCSGDPSSIPPQYDCNGCNDHQDGNSSDQFAASTFGEARYCGEAEVFRHREGCYCKF